MNAPFAADPMKVADSTFAFASWVPVPTMGALPINSFLIKGQEPVLVDTGMAGLRTEFLQALGGLIDPADLRWIWVTHMDADHVGNLAAVLEMAPKARVVTSFVGVAKMGLLGLPQERAYLVPPGHSLQLADRKLHAIAPPIFDAPETTGFFDEKTGALFSSDCFGAVQPSPSQWADELDEDVIASGMATWTAVDAPWLKMIDRSMFRTRLKAYADLRPQVTLSSHLQPARAMIDTLTRLADQAADAPAFAGPDQAAMERLLGGN